jgi:catechol 2,3-dioxygenase-like lactoylglutathione lyase family enzyme
MTNSPKLVFDHIAIVARNLDEGVDYVRQQLGIEMPNGGAHPIMGTHNRLLSLGETEFLEVIAIDPDAMSPNRARWFDLDRFDGAPRIGTWLLGTSDIKDTFHPAHGQIIDMKRGDLKWQISVRKDGLLSHDGAFPQIIEWPKISHPAGQMGKCGCRLKSFEISHPDALRIQEFLAGTLQDDRISVVQGNQSFKAVLETPNGLRILT